MALTLRRQKGNPTSIMKFLLKPFLLFLLIVAGKAVKQQATIAGSIAEKQRAASGIVMRPKQASSFFTRQIADAPARTITARQFWHTATTRTEQVDFE